MRIALMTLCVLGAISALPVADPLQPPAPEVASSKLWAAIAVNRPVIDPDTITQERFLMHFALVNDGDQTIETGANESQLIVNGKVVESREWLTAPAPAPVAGVGRVGSAPPPAPHKLMTTADPGPRGGWEKLPPGENTGTAVPVEKLFAKPGTYRVSWKGKSFESPEIVFRILPRNDRPVRGANPPNTTAAIPHVSGAAPKLPPGTLWAAVGLDRLVLDAGEGFLMNLAIVNDGDQTVDPGFRDSYLVVNGQPLQDDRWTSRLNNGVFSGTMFRLPPGGSTGVVYPMGRFFAVPGTYRVSWKSTSFESPEIVFRVLPRKQK